MATLGTGFWQEFLGIGGSPVVSGSQAPLLSGDTQTVQSTPAASGVSAVKGTVQTGNAISPWEDEKKRKEANNAWLAPYGLSADQSYNLFDADGNYINRGALGMDSMGGVFNPSGYSSNPNFLQGTIGVDRNQLAGTSLAGLSDKALQNAYTVNGAGNRTFANDLWVDPVSGDISSMKGLNSVSVGDIRQTLAGMTGQQYVDSFGAAAPFVNPGYYDGKSDNTADMAVRQQALIAKLLQSPSMSNTATTPPGGSQTTMPDIVQEIINPTDELRKKWLAEELARYHDSLAAQ